MNQPEKVCRWGVLGAASIARKNVRAMHLAENAHPLAIASRDLAKATAFASEHRVDRAYGSYEALLEDPDVDAVYIPLPTTLHREWTIRAAGAGKHVLCEKPVAPNASDVEAMIEACRDAGVQFMDGVMFMHHARMQLLKSRLSDIGKEPNLITSAFSFRGDDSFFAQDIRGDVSTEPLGCVGDLAWYSVRIILETMDAMPDAVRARHHRLHNGVPIHTSAEMDFSGVDEDRHAFLSCSFVHPLRQWVEICGPTGTMRMDDFVIGSPTEACLHLETESRLTEKDLIHERQIERLVTPDCIQEVEMMRTFSEIARGATPLQPGWGAMSHSTQKVIDAIMNSASADGKSVTIPN
ncbi:MAG: Gfo/Idh/MocA family oxidoreductase [Planctomycetota bacterium]|jgi:predicted dehydrogenase|nr:Gfo/Idh/MocA family oxidoreductase [Planctomycetota bacterium]